MIAAPAVGPRRRVLALALLAVAAPLAGQQAPAAPAAAQVERGEDDVDAHLFYRAYFVEHGLGQPEEALALYERFLAAHAEHPLAGQAARQAIRILRAGERGDEAEALAERHAAVLAETVPLGINEDFLDPDADVARFVSRFESESREVFAQRRALVDLVGLEEGQDVADIGAGTGLFTNLFARAVGEDGTVYAVEIGPRLVEHLRALATTMKLPQVRPVLGTARSTMLEPESIDVAFVCDTYHHFEQPAAMLASIRAALRRGGELVVVEFERIPGKSRPWLLDHVRAGREVFRAEIEKAGFRLVREEPAAFLRENYVLRFAKEE